MMPALAQKFMLSIEMLYALDGLQSYLTGYAAGMVSS
jgi:hypothetical protein